MSNKSSNNILLSICIPTYNQPDDFQTLLDNLSNQITSEIEFVIRDDSTDDKTSEIVDIYSNQLPIRYFRGKREGLDVAILFLTQEARGQFIWWLGNETVLSGAIEKILNLVKSHQDLSFIWLNSGDKYDSEARAFIDSEDKFFKDCNEIIETDPGLLGFISATLFRRERALPGIESAKQYIGTAWVCLYLILTVITGQGSKYLVAKPYILAEPKPPGEVRWYDQFQVFCINFILIFNQFKDKFNATSFKKSLSGNLIHVIRAIVVERAMGFTTGFGTKTPKLILMLSSYWNYWQAWAAIPLLILPRSVLKVFYSLYQRL